MGNDENTLVLLFALQQFLLQPLQHFSRISGVINKEVVLDIARQSIQGNNLQIELRQQVWGVISMQTQGFSRFRPDPLFPNLGEVGLEFWLSCSLEIVDIVWKSVFVAVYCENWYAWRCFGKDFCDHSGVVHVAGLAAKPNIVWFVVSCPKD